VNLEVLASVLNLKKKVLRSSKMIDFLSPNIIIEVTCFVIAIAFLHNDVSTTWKSMILFMLVICITEIAGIITKRTINGNNWVYNIYLMPEAGFVSITFGHLISKYTKSKIIVLPGLALLFVLYLYEIYKHGIYNFNTLTTTIMSLLFICYGLYYYYLLIKDEQYINLKTYAPFWWVSGTLFFYFGSIVSNLNFSVLSSDYLQLFSFRHAIYILLNIVLYSFWSYSFLCRYRQRNSIL